MILRFVIALAIGLPLGAWTARSALRTDLGFGALEVAEWTAWPQEGSSEADPYARAKVASRGSVPLGVGEGIAFEAIVDHGGKPLDGACNYVVSGRTPKARIWTLAAHRRDGDGSDGAVLRGSDGQAASLTSRDLVRAEDGSFEIGIGAMPQPGAWLPVDPKVVPVSKRKRTNSVTLPMAIVLRLYDSPVATSAELFEPTMPTITRKSCQ